MSKFKEKRKVAAYLRKKEQEGRKSKPVKLNEPTTTFLGCMTADKKEKRRK